MKTMIERAAELQQNIIDIRHTLHKDPEFSFKEYRTTAYIKEVLGNLGIEIIDWGGETGVVGLLKGAKSGAVVALRADIDALPIQEENDCAYRSQNQGIMHACGHDVHTASLLGAAMLLAEKREHLAGMVKFLFQPAEEINAGAKYMLEKNVLVAPTVSVIFGLHNSPNISSGQVCLKTGGLMAAVDTTFLTVKGVGGHGGIPHLTCDPITATAAIIQGLQTIVSRQVNPLEPAVISFGTICGGHANNVIPEKVELTGTVRTFNRELQVQMPEKMRSVINSIAAAMRTEAEFVYRKDLPAVVNPPELVEWCRMPLEKVFGPTGLVDTIPSMGGEDFACFQEKIPGVFLFLGAGNAERGIVNQWHNPRFDADDDCLRYGAAALAQLAFDYLEQHR
ncbi:MAG TPA: M20 family metallopeptidase [Patescibacteria group bacterium]|nr:M20 family metallopeptidase [Patescibacteria group bacterium]